VVTIFVHRNGRTEQVSSIEPAWLESPRDVFLWVDLSAPTMPESLILSDTFGFHPLSVEDAMTEVHYPKIEAYDGYLYIILHGIDFHDRQRGFATHDTDFFLGPGYLVTVHDGHSRSIAELKENLARKAKILGEGPVALFHRILDAMVERYRPEVDKLEARLTMLEDAVFEGPEPTLIRRILDEKQQVATLRRIVTPQRDVVARLARREYADITLDMSFRFRDVFDALVRISDDAMIFQDRISGILDAHLSNVSNRLNEVMKVLTVLTTVFMPLTVLTGMYGMNIPLPKLPGGDQAQFWWLLGFMAGLIVAMLAFFRRRHWI
jgi:magnesium transporter